MKHCILCGKSNDSVRVASNKRFGLDAMYCKKCKLGYSYADDKRIKESYKKFYEEEFWHTAYGKSKIYTPDLKSRSIMAGIRILRALGVSPLIAITHYDMMKKYAPDGSLIEIGPGEGYSLRFFRKKYDVRAMEPDRINTNKINRYFRSKVCISGDAETDDIKGKYDVVYMCHVFEHLISPLKFLGRIKKNMTADGIILVEVPNCEFDEMMQTSAAKNETHIYHYTLTSIRSLFKKAGFDVLESDVYDPSSNNIFTSTVRSILHIPSYKRAPLKSGIKIVLIARKKHI